MLDFKKSTISTGLRWVNQSSLQNPGWNQEWISTWHWYRLIKFSGLYLWVYPNPISGKWRLLILTKAPKPTTKILKKSSLSLASGHWYVPGHCCTILHPPFFTYYFLISGTCGLLQIQLNHGGPTNGAKGVCATTSAPITDAPQPLEDLRQTLGGKGGEIVLPRKWMVGKRSFPIFRGCVRFGEGKPFVPHRIRVRYIYLYLFGF